MAKEKKLTYSELSKRSGISIATISRVMNRSNLVTDQMRRKVLNALSECGVDTKAYEIESEDEKLIIFNVPTLKNVFYSSIISASRVSAERRGYTLLVNEYPISEDNKDKFIRLIRRTKAMGLIIANPMNSAMIEEISQEVPTVSCTENAKDSSVPYVTIDDEGAAYNAVSHIISLGRKKIAFINGPDSFKYARERRDGYTWALKDAGLEVDGRYIATVGEDMDYDEAKAAAIHILSYPERPDAFFLISDRLACAVEKAALERGLRVPEDLVIVGFDNTLDSKMANPSITTVRQPTAQMGALASEMVITMIEKGTEFVESVILGTELIIRESSMLKK